MPHLQQKPNRARKSEAVVEKRDRGLFVTLTERRRCLIGVNQRNDPSSVLVLREANFM